LANNEHTVRIDDNGLPPAKLLEAGCDGLDSLVVDSRIPFVRLDPSDGPHLDLHGALLPAAKSLGALHLKEECGRRRTK
jgi:hypothetical protein